MLHHQISLFYQVPSYWGLSLYITILGCLFVCLLVIPSPPKRLQDLLLTKFRSIWMEWWNDGMMEWWNYWMIEWWKDGIMEQWNDKIMEYWTDGIMELLDDGILEIWNDGVLGGKISFFLFFLIFLHFQWFLGTWYIYVLRNSQSIGPLGQNMVDTTLPDGLETSGWRVYC